MHHKRFLEQSSLNLNKYALPYTVDRSSDIYMTDSTPFTPDPEVPETLSHHIRYAVGNIIFELGELTNRYPALNRQDHSDPFFDNVEKHRGCPS